MLVAAKHCPRHENVIDTMGWRSFQELQMRSCSGQLAFSIWCFEQASIQGDSSQSSFPSSPCSLATPKNHVMHLIEWHQRSRKPSKAWLFHQPQRWQLCCRQEKLPTEEPWVRMTLLYKRFHKFTRFPAQVWIWTVRDKSWQDLEVCPVKSATFPMLRKTMWLFWENIGRGWATFHLG